VIGSFYYVF